MKTFDYEQVGAVIAPLKARFEDCTHGEGNACATLDSHLQCCASICFEVVQAVKKWARAVFSGEVIFDPAAESRWRSELAQLHSQAIRVWQVSRKAEVPCYELPGQSELASVLWEMQWLLDNWISPKLSVGPMARSKVKLSDEQKAGVREQLSALPPLERPVNK